MKTQVKKTIFIAMLAIVSFSNIAHAQYTKLLDFAGATNGIIPEGSLISDGTFLYGMTSQGGTNGQGTIFKIMPNGTGYVKLLDFDGGITGSYSSGSLIFDGTFLYGMTGAGGTNGRGTIFKIMPNGSGYEKLLDFVDTINGSYPFGSLISDGTFLYGMTSEGGTNDKGTIFKIMPNGSGYVKLLDFVDTTNGSHPRDNLISDGTFLYGMTSRGGTNELGTIFKIMPNGTGYLKLLDFVDVSNGSYPNGNLISDGTFLYGLTVEGGTNSLGTIFKITPNGTGFVKLLDFAGVTNGSSPHGSLISDGTFLYGMTQMGGTNDMGTIFKIMPDGTGFVKLLDFDSTNGNYPYGALISNGTFLYGMTSGGGTNNQGVMFKYSLAAVGIDELSMDNNELSIYPNPAIDNVTISLNAAMQNAQVGIYNVFGQKVYSAVLTTKQETINTNQFSSGIYFVKVSNREKTFTKKLIIE